MTTDGTAAQAGRILRPAEVRVWDPVVRLFHWSLVTAFATAWLSETGETLQNTAGYVVLGLVAIRLLWGFVGGRHARFAAFVRSPAEIIRYLRQLVQGKAARHLGHSPAGGAMIVALLAMVALTAGSGCLSITDRFWGIAWVEELHGTAADLTLALVGLHVLGVLVSSLLHRENLAQAMITGRKRID